MVWQVDLEAVEPELVWQQCAAHRCAAGLVDSSWYFPIYRVIGYFDDLVECISDVWGINDVNMDETTESFLVREGQSV